MQRQQQQQQQMLITLYYKTTCEHSKKILNSLIPHKDIVGNVNFISLDTFYKNREGQLCVQLQNGSVVIIPSQINRVPALFIYNRTQQQQHQFIFGDDILKYFSEYIQHMKNEATNGNGQVVDFTGFEKSGVVSDSYGLLNEDLYGDLPNAKNSQMHSYVDVNSMMSNNNLGLLGKPLHDLKQQFDPSEFMSKDQMSQGTQYNQNQFRIQQQFQNPAQFPKGMFLEGQMQQQQQQQSQNTNTSYNQNEFFSQQQQQQQQQQQPMYVDEQGNKQYPIPDRLRSTETKKEGFEDDMKKQMEKLKSERNYIGGGNGANGANVQYGF